MPGNQVEYFLGKGILGAGRAVKLAHSFGCATTPDAAGAAKLLPQCACNF